MVSRWTFRAARTTSGNVIVDWLGSDVRLRARVESFLRRLRELPHPWPPTYYGPLGDGIGEIRVDLRNVEHRLYGFFGYGPDEFTIISASSDKKKQQTVIEQVKKRYKQIKTQPIETEEYVV
jgi:hypothetical protein